MTWLNDLAAFIEQFGFPVTFAIIAMGIFVILVRGNLSAQSALAKRGEADQSEAIKWRNAHQELDKKYTICREENVALKKDKELNEYKHLDDTEDLDRFLNAEKAKNSDLEERLRECSETVLILQARNRQLLGISQKSGIEVPQETNESQKELSQKSKENDT